MGISQSRPNRKQSGSRYTAYRKQKLNELAKKPTLTKLEERRSRTTRVLGANIKSKLLSTNIANVFDPKSKKYSRVKIKTIVESPANRHFTRRNIMTKGCLIDTEAGKAKVTSRPGQDGTVNAILV